MYGSPEQTQTKLEMLPSRKQTIQREIGQVSLEDYLKQCDKENIIGLTDSPDFNEIIKHPKTDTIELNSRDMIRVPLGKEHGITTSRLDGRTALALVIENGKGTNIYLSDYDSAPDNQQQSVKALKNFVYGDMPKNAVIRRAVLLTPADNAELPKNPLLIDYLKDVIQQNSDEENIPNIQVCGYKENRDITDNEVTLKVECSKDGKINIYSEDEILLPTPES